MLITLRSIYIYYKESKLPRLLPSRFHLFAVAFLTLIAPIAVVACGGDDEKTLTLYSGRSEELVGPLLDKFTEDTGIEVEVRYGDTAEVAATILEEGGNSPADVFFAQDAGALGALDNEVRLADLPQSILEMAPEIYRSPDGKWVGVSGRARVLVYNTDTFDESDLPASVYDLTDEEWDGRVGWAPTNGSFQSFVTAMRVVDGDEAALQWLQDMRANGAREYANNSAIVEAVGRGEIDAGLVNHYYLLRFLDEQGEGFAARNHFFEAGDPGVLVNVAGAAIVDTSDSKDLAERFIEYLLSEEAQRYFADETFEYPLLEGVEINPVLVPLHELDPPDIDLSDVSDLEGTLDLLREAGVLP